MWPPLASAVRGRTWLPIQTHKPKASPREEGGLDVVQPKNDEQSWQPSCLLERVHPAVPVPLTQRGPLGPSVPCLLLCHCQIVPECF